LRQIFGAETGGSAPVRRAEPKFGAETAGGRTGWAVALRRAETAPNLPSYGFGAPKHSRSSEQTPPEARAVFQGYNASSVIFALPVKPKRDALDDWRVSAVACDLKVIPARTE